ncbi:uncharacterized protein LOC121863814 isoform X2 [Homarus americanus]|nr:uncharacterized protein LOC121863814 isoform X2 [Homarus americanus]
MATGSSTVFEGVVTMAVDGSSTAAAVVGSTLILIGVMLTVVSAVGYKRYTKYRSRQVGAVMARARRMARGEGASPAFLDLGSGGELLRVMAACDNTVTICDTVVPLEAYCNGKICEVNMGEITTNSGRSGSVDNLATRISRKSASVDTLATTNSRKSGSVDNLADLRTIDISPGMIVLPVYLVESSCTVNVYMPDEHEAPLWLYTDMLMLFWVAVFLASIGHTFLNAAFIILGVAFNSLPNVTIDILCGVFGCIGGVCIVAAGAVACRCYKVYHKYLRESAPSPFEETTLTNGPAIWQLL